MAALHRNSWFDRIVNSVTLTTIAMPEFFIAYILVYVFAVLRISIQSRSVSERRFSSIYRAALPATMTLVIIVT
jgi:peptide/nickel transport system permease protein